MTQEMITRRGKRGSFRVAPAPPPAPAPRRPRRIQWRGVLAAVLVAAWVFIIAAQVRNGRSSFIAASYRRVVEFLYRPRAAIERDISAHTLARGNPARAEIALTFDDAPHAATTRQLLAILRQQGVTATFFLIGQDVRKYPDIARDIVAAGHAIGNHTEHHDRLLTCSTEQINEEITACDESIRAATGRTTRLFRPPGGRYDRRSGGAAIALGYTLVQWSCNPGDYTRPGVNVITKRVLDTVSNGSIILLHDSNPQVIQALPGLIAALRRRGYAFVTIEEMMRR